MAHDDFAVRSSHGYCCSVGVAESLLPGVKNFNGLICLRLKNVIDDIVSVFNLFVVDDSI
jgi:hypothetical protein